MALRISVYDSKELQATIRVMKGLPREIAKQVRSQSKEVIGPVWQEAVRGNSINALQVRVLGDTARARISDQNVTLTAGTIGKPLTGGGTPPELAAGTEFGSRRFHQFGTRVKGGKVAYAAAAQVIPRIASLWIQTVIRTTYEQLEKVTKHG